MSGWDELVAASLIGTDRRPIAATVPEGSPAGLAEALESRDPEDRLLGAAAAWTVARRAGARPAGDAGTGGASPGVDVAGPDDRVIAPRARLEALLGGEYAALLPEWLALAARAGLRPPPELVPALLDRAVAGAELHRAVGEAAGPLGRWLAAREPRWRFVLGVAGDVDDVWAHGERAERRALLERLRRADPDAARERLARTFAEEAGEDRQAFVAALAVGLSDADEPFLEAALDDGRRSVRAAAARCLGALPASRFAARMAARAAPLLRVDDGRLIAELPGPPDEALKRDGFESGGRRADRLTALLAATPLTTWVGAGGGGRVAASPGGGNDGAAARAAGPLGASPAAVVRLPVADDLAPAVHNGWVGAAVRQRDVGWARELWFVTADPRALAVLPRVEAEALAAEADDPYLAAFGLRGQWGLHLSRAIAAGIVRQSAANPGLPSAVASAAYQLDPAVGVRLEGRGLDSLVDVLEFRAAMLRELS